jgi:hypothetical protein
MTTPKLGKFGPLISDELDANGAKIRKRMPFVILAPIAFIPFEVKFTIR